MLDFFRDVVETPPYSPPPRDLMDPCELSQFRFLLEAAIFFSLSTLVVVNVLPYFFTDREICDAFK